MRPRRTPGSNAVFYLVGGTEDNDLWVRQNHATITSVWELDETDRAAIAAGENIELTVWGAGTPPIALRTTDEPLGAAQVSPRPYQPPFDLDA